MYSSNLLESDFALTTGKHTQITIENSNGIRDLRASNVSHVLKKPLQCVLQLNTQVTLLKSHSETITMPMICSLIEHDFLPVFSIQ